MSPKNLLKLIFLCSIIGFLITNLSFNMDFDESEEEQEQIFDAFKKNASIEEDRRIIESSKAFRQKIIEKLKYEPIHNNMDFTLGNFSQVVLDTPLKYKANEIRHIIWEANRQQNVLNLDKFDLTASDSALVVVVQVHNRTEYLQHLIDSLRVSKDTDKILLIFSHDFYSEELNNIVNMVDFCPMLQIFYPYPMQLYQEVFPGEDPKDCPRNVDRIGARRMNCQNKDYPDRYGHYREAAYSQIKLHWFWKLNHIFDYLNVTRNFNGPVLFLEEDHYLVPDFIQVLHLMHRLKTRLCSNCKIITLGTYDKKPAYASISNKVDIMNWVSSKHNMGMSFTREVWNEIKKCGLTFCRFDDYNWDWSLHSLGTTCLSAPLRVMVMKSPRIFHIGECGLHSKGKNCSPSEHVEMIQRLLKDNSQYLFPDQLLVGGYPATIKRPPKANGGWGDIRDHQLCASFMEADSHR